MRGLLMVILGMAASATTIARGQDAKPADDGPLRVACVGDSITFGSGIENRETNSYPAQLQGMLGEGYEVRNFGVSGATAQKRGDHPYWTTDAFKDVSLFKPDVVIIKLGTNDSKPQNWHGAEPFRIDLASLINHFQALPDKPQVFLCMPVPVHEEAFDISQRVVREEIVPAVRDVAKTAKVPTIDLFKPLADAQEDFPDGVHPNADGAKKIATAVARAIQAKHLLP